MPMCVFSEITYPDSLYIIDKESGYKIMLGSSPEFAEIHFGQPKAKLLKFSFTSPDYEIWDIIYDGFEIRYQTYDKMISGIKITTDVMCTSENISVGSSLSEVIQAYGNPTRTRVNKEGEIEYQYAQFIKEINLDSEYTVVIFIILNDKVKEIAIDIVSTV
jgi:hypothetical protein